MPNSKSPKTPCWRKHWNVSGAMVREMSVN
jgi:hypothetical protein